MEVAPQFERLHQIARDGKYTDLLRQLYETNLRFILDQGGIKASSLEYQLKAKAIFANMLKFYQIYEAHGEANPMAELPLLFRCMFDSYNKQLDVLNLRLAKLEEAEPNTFGLEKVNLLRLIAESREFVRASRERGASLMEDGRHLMQWEIPNPSPETTRALVEIGLNMDRLCTQSDRSVAHLPMVSAIATQSEAARTASRMTSVRIETDRMASAAKRGGKKSKRRCAKSHKKRRKNRATRGLCGKK